MTAIPPHSIASALQAGVTQAEQVRQTDADKNAQADRARRTSGGPDAILEIEETDSDTQVHTDAGGGGSQGRHDAPPEEEVVEQTPDTGITVDQNGQPHLDLSA